MKLKKLTEYLKATVFITVLVSLNLHLFLPTSPALFIYQHDKVALGEWWRLITHPFVHVSWYHLLLDSAAVLLLLNEIPKASSIGKLLIAFCCGAGSLTGAIVFSPLLEHTGYCGLSGVAHGLMFFLGLSWLKMATPKSSGSKGNTSYLIGGITLLVLSGMKSLYETVSGKVVFSTLHPGEIGIPIVEAHLGGVIGGAIAYLLLQLMQLTQKTLLLSAATHQEP